MNSLLNEYLTKFERDGYVVIKNAISSTECKKLIQSTLLKILHKKGIYITKPQTWNYKYSRRKQGILISGKNGNHIISKHNKYFRFPALYNSKMLNSILNLIHARYTNNNERIKWNYQYMGNEGLGWIHLRFPYYNNNNKNNKNDKNVYIHSSKCITDNSFHLDGTYIDNNNNTKVNYEQSVVILPFITTVKKNGGGTAVIPGSHKLINDYLLRHHYNSNLDIENIIEKIVINQDNNIIDICGNQGDILIMHPHLIHSSSIANSNSRTRITFNLGTKKINN